MVDTLLTYIHADAACCREDVGPLAARQAEVRASSSIPLMTLICQYLMFHMVYGQVYGPIVAWACEAFRTDFVVSNSVFGTTQHDSAVDSVRKHLEGR